MSDEWGAGPRSEWRPSGTALVGRERVPLFFGQHPHSRQDNNAYVEMNGEAVGFSGFRVLIDVRITSRNYLKTSGLSGDEVRSAVAAVILADGEPVYEIVRRKVEDALVDLRDLLIRLSEHASGWLLKDERDRLVGRKVYYREVPAVIERLIVDQGCVMIRTESGQPFPPPVYAEPGDDEAESTIKDDVLSPHIWWFRG